MRQFFLWLSYQAAFGYWEVYPARHPAATVKLVLKALAQAFSPLPQACMPPAEW